MKYIFTTIVLFIAMGMQAQDSLNMSVLYRFDPDTIPTNGSREFSECFGYVTCEGAEIAIIGSSARVHFFDVTDPENSYEIDWFSGGNVTTWRDMATYKDHVYSVCDACTEGLMIFDMSDAPNSVALTSQPTEFFSKSHNIFIDQTNGRLYSMGTDSLGNGLVVLDVDTAPGSPTLLKNMVLPGGYVHDMYVDNNIAYCNHGNNGMYAYDFTDLDNPIVLGTLTDYPESGYNHSSYINADGTTLVLCDETHNRGVKTINIEDPSNMYVEQVFRSTLLAPADSASIAHNPLIRGNIAFISYYHDGVQVYDISDPTNVQKIAYYDTEPGNTTYGGFTGNWGVYPFLPSGNILASDMTNGLFVLSLENVDLVEADHSTYPFAEINAVGSTNICEGDSVVIYAEEGYDTYNWTDGNGGLFESADSIVVYNSGNYTVCISDGHCSTCTLEDLEIEVSEYPDVELIVEGAIEFCEGESTMLSVKEGASFYIWTKDGATIMGANENALTVTESGIYKATASNNGCNATSVEQEVTVFPTTPFSIVNDDNLLMSQAGVSYQWYFDDEPIAGATAQEYEANEDGNYYVVIQDANGCQITSETLEFIFNSTQQIEGLNQFTVFPNPTNDILFVQMETVQVANFEIALQTVDGKMLKTFEKEVAGKANFEIDMTDLPAGFYLLKVTTGEGRLVKKITKK